MKLKPERSPILYTPLRRKQNLDTELQTNSSQIIKTIKNKVILFNRTMSSDKSQELFATLQSTLLQLTIACKTSFKEIGTEVKEANNKIENLESMVKNLTVLVKDQQDKIIKKEGQDMNQECSGQVIFKRIPFRMKAIAEEKLKCSEVQRFDWIQTTSNGDFLTLWISHNSNTMMTNAIGLKLNWERELPPNSPDRKLVSLIIVEQVAPRAYRPLLAKLKNELVNMRENGTFVPTFVQTVKFEASSGTLAYVYQQKPTKTTRATILGYVANQKIRGREFENVAWFDVNTGKLNGEIKVGLSAAAAHGDPRQVAHKNQFATGANRLLIRERKGEQTYPKPHKNIATPRNYYESNRNQRGILNIDNRGRILNRPIPEIPIPKLKLNPKHEEAMNKPSTWISTSYLLLQDEIANMNPQPEIIYGGKEETEPEVVMLRMQIEIIQQDKCPLSLKKPTKENTTELINIMKIEMTAEPDISLFHWMSELSARDPRRRILMLAISENDDISAQMNKLGSSKSSLGDINTLLHTICRSLLQYQITPSNFLQVKMEAVVCLSDIFEVITTKIKSAIKKIESEEKAGDIIDLDLGEDSFKFNAMREYFLEAGCTDPQLLEQVDLKHSELTTISGINYADIQLAEYINIFPWEFIIGNKMIANDYYSMKSELNFFHMDDPTSNFEEEMDQNESKIAKRKRASPETPTKPEKKTTASLAIVNRKLTPIKPRILELSALEIEDEKIEGISKLHDSTENLNPENMENEIGGIADLNEPQSAKRGPHNRDTTTISMKAASALYNKVTAKISQNL